MSADTGKLRLEAAEEQAKAKGCIVVKPLPNELFIDIDRPEDLSYFMKQIQRINLRWPCEWERRPSPSGVAGRYHVYVRFKDREITDWQRIALQAVLGSDRVRELISVQRLLDGDVWPTLFFEKDSQ